MPQLLRPQPQYVDNDAETLKRKIAMLTKENARLRQTHGISTKGVVSRVRRNPASYGESLAYTPGDPVWVCVGQTPLGPWTRDTICDPGKTKVVLSQNGKTHKEWVRPACSASGCSASFGMHSPGAECRKKISGFSARTCGFCGQRCKSVSVLFYFWFCFIIFCCCDFPHSPPTSNPFFLSASSTTR